MLESYIKIAMRTLWKEKTYALINVAGLAIGLASCILLMLYVQNELAYDTFHKDADRLYRVWVTEDPPERDAFSYSFTSAAMAGALESSLPAVERTVRVATRTDLIRVGNESFTERIHLVDSDFFEVFSFPLLRGSPESVLRDPASVVLTRKMADKLFGSDDVLDQRISIKLGETFHDFIVAGVAADAPENSSIKFKVLVQAENLKKYLSERALTSMFNIYLETYVRLARPMPPAELVDNLSAVVANHYPERFREMVTLNLQPITDIHLNPDVPAGIETTSKPLYSYLLAGIALLILLLACINFTTLAVGRSARRAREVGVRKVLGAMQPQLARQFCGETILMSSIALLLGIVLAHLFLPFFNHAAQKELTFSPDFASLVTLAAFALVVGLLAGSYPAFVLSRFQPVNVLRGSTAGAGPGRLRHMLIVFQFSISIFLIISTLIVGQQLRYLQTRNLGFNQEQVVVIQNNSGQAESFRVTERLRTDLANDRRFVSVSGASSSFGRPWTTMGFMANDGTFKSFYQLTADYHFLETMQINLVSGRNFSKEFATDSSEAMLVNQAMADYFNWQDPLTEKLPGDRFPAHQIIGVMENFNFESLETEVAPLVIVLKPLTLLRGINDVGTSYSPRSLNFIHVRVASHDLKDALDHLRSKWQEVAANHPFTFTFLDQDVQKQYDEQERWGRIIMGATSFALFIAGMGLFGLSAVTVSQKRKEIGIRKVLGASISNIVILLSNEFGKLVLIANVIAWPLAFWVMRDWLQNFAYSVGIHYLNFLIAALIALVIAWVSVSFQSVKAATSDPVETLKFE